MRAVAKFSDTATREAGGIADIPGQMVVTMILNEVASHSVDGGTLSLASLKRDKPELIVLANSKQDCQKVVKAFHSVFTSNSSKNKKDSFDVDFLIPEKENGNKLLATVDSYIEKKKSKHTTLTRKPLQANSISQNQWQPSAGVIEMRR